MTSQPPERTEQRRDVARECELAQRMEMAAKLIRRGKVAQALALLEGRPEE